MISTISSVILLCAVIFFRKRMLIHTVLVILSLVLFMLPMFFSAKTVTKDIPVSENTLNMIAEIDWSDEKFLADTGAHITYGNQVVKDDGVLIKGEVVLNIRSSPFSENERIPEEQLTVYKDFSYCFTEKYSFDPQYCLEHYWKSIRGKKTVSRSYTVYADGMEICMNLITYNGSEDMFEKAIAELNTKYDALATDL